MEIDVEALYPSAKAINLVCMSVEPVVREEHIGVSSLKVFEVSGTGIDCLGV